VTFNKEVIGLSVSDFTLNASTTNAVLSGVTSGPSNVYTLMVSGATQEGTYTITTNSNGPATDNAGNHIDAGHSVSVVIGEFTSD